MKTEKKFETGCCPRFHPEQWEEKEIIFKDKLFLKDHVTNLFHIPLNFGKVMERNMEKIEAAGAKSPEPIVLTEEISPWSSDIHIAIQKEFPNADIEKLSGTYLSKVFEGSYNKMGEYVEEMHTYLNSKGKSSDKLFFYYPYCPKCAKAYGTNYIVILAEVTGK